MVFGGPIPPELYAANVPDPDANAGALGVPVVVTRRGELRTVRTHFPASGPDDVQDAAPASVDLVDGVEPGPAFLGLVQSHEDPAEVFRAHLEAATTHKAAVDTSKAAQVRPELPPRTVPADVVDVAPVANRARRDLDAILDDARALTDTDIEAMGESPEDW
ncbi:hypothetical protein [Nocardiopsis alba]|uniref:hypothetical protein n=1 Tax=Nocardiopsis alba TaxID=53437 RepID=UPI00340BB238